MRNTRCVRSHLLLAIVAIACISRSAWSREPVAWYAEPMTSSLEQVSNVTLHPSVLVYEGGFLYPMMTGSGFATMSPRIVTDKGRELTTTSPQGRAVIIFVTEGAREMVESLRVRVRAFGRLRLLDLGSWCDLVDTEGRLRSFEVSSGTLGWEKLNPRTWFLEPNEMPLTEFLELLSVACPDLAVEWVVGRPDESRHRSLSLAFHAVPNVITPEDKAVWQQLEVAARAIETSRALALFRGEIPADVRSSEDFVQWWTEKALEGSVEDFRLAVEILAGIRGGEMRWTIHSAVYTAADSDGPPARLARAAYFNYAVADGGAIKDGLVPRIVQRLADESYGQLPLLERAIVRGLLGVMGDEERLRRLPDPGVRLPGAPHQTQRLLEGGEAVARL